MVVVITITFMAQAYGRSGAPKGSTIGYGQLDGLVASGALGYAALVTFVLAALRTVRSTLGAAV